MIKGYGSITPKDVSWLWEDKIPLADVTVAAGAPGACKTFHACDWGVRTAMSWPFPTADYASSGLVGPSSVILATLEDDADTSVVRRLIAAGATKTALQRIYDMSVVQGRPFQIERDLDRLRAAITGINVKAQKAEAEGKTGYPVRLVIIEPLKAATALAIGHPATVRYKIMAPLRSLASSTGKPELQEAMGYEKGDPGAAFVLMHHTLPSGKIAGSSEIIECPRSVLRIENGAVRIEKTNIASMDQPEALFELTGSWPDMRIAWEGETREDVKA